MEDLVERCLAAFIRAGTLDLSLDQLAASVGISKRMLVHYFRSRENIEERAMTLLEQRLRAQFAPGSFHPDATGKRVIRLLWDQVTAPASRGLLLLVMDVSRRAWKGSKRAKAFYRKQQELWVELLLNYLPSRATAEQVLQLFQGAVLAYLVTGDRKTGRRALRRLLSKQRKSQRP